MGLDQYGYVVKKHRKNTDFCVYWQLNEVHPELQRTNMALLAEWRKHPYLQGWMENLFNLKADAQNFEGYIAPGGLAKEVEINAIAYNLEGERIDIDSEMLETLQNATKEMGEKIIELSKSEKPQRVFNNQPIRLTLTDLEQLETAVLRGELPVSSGFFWGEDASEEYKEEDLAFIKDAREALANNMDVYYSSWW